MLADSTIGVVAFTCSLAGVVAVQAAVYGGGSCIRVDPRAPVFACAFGRVEGILIAATSSFTRENYIFCDSLAQVSLSVIVRSKTSFPGVLSLSKAK